MALKLQKQTSLIDQVFQFFASISNMIGGKPNMSDNLVIPPEITEILLRIDEVSKASGKSDVSKEVRVHVQSMMQMAGTSLAAISLPPCQLASPHTSIQVGYDSAGNFRLECLHSPTHCWNLSGFKCTC